MDILDLLLEKVEIFLLVIILGFFAKKIGYFKKEFSVELGNLLLKIITPLTIFNSFMVEKTSNIFDEFFLTFIIFAVIQFISIVVSLVVFKGNKYGIERFALIAGNVGFFGLPLVISAFGQEAGIFAAIIVAINSSVMWTCGVYMLSHDKKSISLTNIIKTPNVIATILGTICFLFNIQTPTIIQDAINSLSSVSSPMCALIIGATLAETEFKEIKQDQSNIICTIVRMIVIPIIVSFLLKFIDNNHLTLKLILLTMTCVPTAGSTSIFAYEYNYDADKAARLVCVTSILCVITIPIITNFAVKIW